MGCLPLFYLLALIMEIWGDWNMTLFAAFAVKQNDIVTNSTTLEFANLSVSCSCVKGNRKNHFVSGGQISLTDRKSLPPQEDIICRTWVGLKVRMMTFSSLHYLKFFLVLKPPYSSS
jgi:hypothetical protein